MVLRCHGAFHFVHEKLTAGTGKGDSLALRESYGGTRSARNSLVFLWRSTLEGTLAAMSRNGVCTSARDISQTEVQEKIIFQWFFEIFFWLFFFRIQFVIGYDNIARFFVLLKGETVIIERCHIKRCMVYLPRKLPLNIALHHSCHTSKCRTLLNQRLLGPSSNVWAAKCS